MQLLDTPLSPPEPASIWKTVARYSVFAAIGFFLTAQLLYRLGFMAVDVLGLVLHLVALATVCGVIAFLAIKVQRDKRGGGYIGFGRALAVSALPICIGQILFGVWNYFFVNYIDPSYILVLKQALRDEWSSSLSPDQLRTLLSEAEELYSLPGLLINSLTNGVPPGLVIGAVAAFFMSRKYPV